MTTSQKRDRIELFRQRLNLLTECLGLAREKTKLLMRHDLAGLEASLVREAETTEQLSQIQLKPEEMGIGHGEELPSECRLVLGEIRAVAEEIEVVNRTNTRLIRHGQHFCQALYAAICPPETYSPSLAVVSRPVEATFQAQF